MKQKISIIIMGLFSLFGCGQNTNLTQKENDLLDKLNLKTELMVELKNLTKNEIKQLPAIDKETGEVVKDQFYKGIFSKTTDEKANEIVLNLKQKFKENGFLIFVYEGEDNTKNVAVIEGENELDILRFRGTSGGNYDLENEDVISKISEWKNKYGLIVVGCSQDWLELKFEKLPADLNGFAKEVYEFCPDSVDQGVGSIDKLKQAISEMKGVWLWWD